MTGELFQIEKLESGVRFSLPNYFDITVASELRDRLVELLDSQVNTILLDGQLCEVADTAVMQVLCAFADEARKKGIHLEWQSPGDAITKTARYLGMEEYLGLQ